jgi:hypothetical protein
MSDRDRRIAGFLAEHGWSADGARPLAGDASFRRYWRVGGNGGTVVLMDAPPPDEDVRPFVAMARHLRRLGLSAPEILAADVDEGLLLIEDFGDETYTRLLAGGGAEPDLYALAIDVLASLHRLPAETAIPKGLPAYDEERLLDEACLLTDWYLPFVTGAPTSPDVRHAYVEAWRAALPAVRRRPPTLVLRDFHVDNLIRLRGRSGIAACGLLDFQDAVAGPAAYDVMSLLEDARRDVGDDLRRAMLDRYRRSVGERDWPGFEAAFAVLAVQRHAKVIGIFTRLHVRDGKPVYLAHVPRVWRLLERGLPVPELSRVAAWFERHVPPPLRTAPLASDARP